MFILYWERISRNLVRDSTNKIIFFQDKQQKKFVCSFQKRRSLRSTLQDRRENLSFRDWLAKR